MTSTPRLRSALVVALALFIAPVLSPRGGTAATWVWPSFNCLQTLQNCIDFAVSGDIVEVASHGPIAETLTIQNKGLTLRPQSGFFPVLAANRSILVLGGSSNMVVTVQGMTLTNGRFILRQAGIGVFDVRVLDNTILDTSSFASAIEVSSGNSQPPYGAVRFDLAGNRISLSDPGPNGQKGGIFVGGFLSSARGRIAGNTVTKSGGPTQSAAIEIANGSTPLNVDVLNNEIRGTGFNAGVSLYQFASGGRLSARVINNLVVGQVNVAGAPAGISLNSSQGTITAQVINNTIVGGDTGVLASARTDLGAVLSGVLANNLVVGHRRFGITVDTEIQSTFANERNLSFRNLQDFFVPGPGTLFVNPLFLTANDFRLRSNSPARDAGSNARVPADITLDLGRLPRIQGAAVAMGAYEN